MQMIYGAGAVKFQQIGGRSKQGIKNSPWPYGTCTGQVNLKIPKLTQANPYIAQREVNCHQLQEVAMYQECRRHQAKVIVKYYNGNTTDNLMTRNHRHSRDPWTSTTE